MTMNQRQKQLAIQLTSALAARNPTIEEEAIIAVASQKTPKLFALCVRLVPKVRQRVAANLAATWVEDLRDLRNGG
jgi:hypothetical protein